MEEFNFPQITIIKNFINKKALTLLRVIKEYPKIFTNYLIIKLGEIEVNYSKSQIYRYINSLERYELIEVRHWKSKPQGKGHSYIINPKGEALLKFLSEMFE